MSKPLDRPWLSVAIDLYRQGHGCTEIAKVVRAHKQTVHRVLLRAGVPIRPRKSVTAEYEHIRPCATCLARIGYGAKAIAHIVRMPLTPAKAFKEAAGQPVRQRKPIALTRKQKSPKSKAPKPAKTKKPSLLTQFKDRAEYNRIQSKKYYHKNKQAIWQRIKNDPQKQTKKRLRQKVWSFIRGLKHGSIPKLVGCDLPCLKAYLEAKFQPGMTWENYGQWHVDHIVPCAHFDLTQVEEQRRCFHYSNLQPLWAKENRVKHARTPDSVGGQEASLSE